MGTSKTIQATQEEKLISVSVEDGEVVCRGRSVITVGSKKIRGPAEELTITSWPIEVEGVKCTRRHVLDLLQALYEGEINARNKS